jgi:dolichyl-phosphate beta-glucosyltransferase
LTPLCRRCTHARLTSARVSVVIPAYNERDRLPPLIEELVRLGLARRAPPIEILVVDDGSADAHLLCHRRCVEDAARRLERAHSPHRARLVEAGANQGKGSAIRLGWREADPDSGWLAFLDADGAVSAGEFFRLAGLLGDEVDVLTGSRVLMAGRRIRRSAFRHVQGRIFATLAEHIFALGFYDTQCGVKFFRSSALRPHLDLLGERTWLLDVEALALLRRVGARAREEPIDWADPGRSKVRPGVDAARMLVGLWRVARRGRAEGAGPAPDTGADERGRGAGPATGTGDRRSDPDASGRSVPCASAR